ncbi:MAG: hypothetical protein QOH32_4723 [Bradyrhizobium sp.]|nr:hypothetical protein [Bradyrhizobium sp.]
MTFLDAPDYVRLVRKMSSARLASVRPIAAGSAEHERSTTPAPATLAPPTSATGWGRAYRAGRLVCARVQVTISHDDRLGLTPRERRYVSARFQAERIDPIQLVVDARDGGCHRVVGRLQPPLLRHGQLRDIEFALHELESTR